MQKMTENLKNKRFALTVIIICFLIPAILILSAVFKVRQLGPVLMLIVVLAMCPFFLMFENRRPHAREIVPVAVMTAIAVTGRVAFIFIPQFKPVIAIVIITALAFGAEAGFMSGALAMLVSNMFFGMSAVTPWQMFCCGLCGFIAGALRKKGLMKSTVSICIYGFFAAYLYSAVADIFSVISFVKEISISAIISVYAAGFWFSTVLAVATVIFLAILAKPIEKKLDRLKLKFGILEI